MSSSSGRIPADKSRTFTTWRAPEVHEGQIVQAEKRLPRRGPSGELLEADKNLVVYNSLTAGQLETITKQVYEDVREQAYRDGLAQGRRDGLAAGAQQIQQQVQRLRDTLDQLFGFLQGQDDEIEQGLVNVAICIARALLRHELSIDSSQIREVVAEAVASLPLGSQKIAVYLNDQDLALLRESGALPESWRLWSAPDLSRGGCRVESQHSVVDFTLEQQFQQVVNQLVEKRFALLDARARERAEE